MGVWTAAERCAKHRWACIVQVDQGECQGQFFQKIGWTRPFMTFSSINLGVQAGPETGKSGGKSDGRFGKPQSGKLKGRLLELPPTMRLVSQSV